MAQNPNLNRLVGQNHQGVNRTFVLAFENDAQRTSNKKYYLPIVYNALAGRKNSFLINQSKMIR